MNAAKKMILSPIIAFQKWRLKKELLSAIEIAKERRYKTHKKHIVLFMGNKFQVYERSYLKELVFKGGTFKKGVSIKDIDRSAYFITD